MKWNKHQRPISWSQIAQFTFSKDAWYKRYVLGIKEPMSKQVEYGSEIGKKIETDPSFLPHIPRRENMEYKMHVNFDDVELIGYADSYGNNQLEEYKTSSSETKWTQKSADEAGQITMYALMLYIQHGTLPETLSIGLHYIPVRENGAFTMEMYGEVKHFNTKRSTDDILKFGVYLKKIINEMEEFSTGQIDESVL